MNPTVGTLLERPKLGDERHVTLAMADYDRTRPIIDGRVKAKGLNIQANTSWIGDFCVRPVYEEYDAAEMSLSWYVMARVRGEPVGHFPVAEVFHGANS